MADIITYPENGITYDADDASGYLCTRESGVYSAEEDFAVSASDGLTVTVGAGHAWVRPTRWVGRSILMEQPAELTLTEADAVRSRIDRIVLRYDAAAKKTSLQVLEGTPDSSGPVAPDITRTALVYDLGLATVRRTAGSTAVTAADITDTRADEAVCGLMRDGVTGIPTAQLQTQAKALLDSLQEEVDSRSFYTKAEADAEHAKLQEQISKAGGNVGQAIVVWDGYVEVPDHKSGVFSLKGKIPDNVDYIVYLNEDPLFSSHGINVIIRRGETIKINNGTGRSYTFAEDGTLSSKYYGSTEWDYFYGYHYVTTAEGAMIPRVVSQSTVYYINGVQNDTYFNVPDETDYIVFQYKSTDYICSRIITRGSSYPGTMTFSSDGKISIPKSQASTFNGCLYTCYHYMTSEELSAQTEALAATQSAQSDTDALAVDQEYRLTLLELGLSE